MKYKAEDVYFSLFKSLILVNILIPKAGIKLYGIPITVGNILLFITLIVWLVKVKSFRFYKIEMIVLFQILFWAIRLGSCFGNQYVKIGDWIGYFAALCIFPMIFIMFPYYVKSEKQYLKLIKIINICVALLMVYGVMQYIFGIAKVAIPGVTVNLTDYQNNRLGWWMEKANHVGISESKIFSTYQNGNIYGVNLLLFLPLVMSSQKKGYIKFVLFSLAIINIMVSGSRSVYVGGVFYLVLVFAIEVHGRKIKLSKIITAIVTASFGVVIIARFLHSNSDFYLRLMSVMNKKFFSGTGRIEHFMEYLYWANRKNLFAFLLGGFGFKYEGGAYEILYFALVVLGGIIGLVLFLYPIVKILKKYFRMKDRKWYQDAVCQGCVVYLFTACMEGAFWLPPTAVNFWFMMGVLYNTCFKEKMRM